MKINAIKTTISAFAMFGVATLGAGAQADNDMQRAGSRAGAAVDRAGEDVEQGAERAWQGTKNTAERAGNEVEQAGDRAGRSAERAEQRMEGETNEAANDMDNVGAEAGDPTGAGAEVSDTWITTKVKAAFVGEEALEQADISVNTEQDGVVTLTGTVRNKAAKRQAERLTKNVEGVSKVNNELKVVRTRNVSGRD